MLAVEVAPGAHRRAQGRSRRWTDPTGCGGRTRSRPSRPAGLTYSRDPFDRERFEQVRAVAAEILDAPHRPRPARRHGAPPGGAGLRDAQGGRTGRRSSTAAGCCWCARSPTDAGPCRADGPTWARVPRRWRRVRRARRAGLEVRVVRLLAVLDKAKHAHPAQLPTPTGCSFCARRRGGLRTSLETPERRVVSARCAAAALARQGSPGPGGAHVPARRPSRARAATSTRLPGGLRRIRTCPRRRVALSMVDA